MPKKLVAKSPTFMRKRLAAAKSFHAKRSTNLQLLHAFALDDASGGADKAAGCDPQQKSFAINRCAQYIVNEEFGLKKPADAKIIIDWEHMSATEVDLHVGHLNFNGNAAPKGLGFEACDLQWGALTREQMKEGTTRGALWSIVAKHYS